MRKNHFNRAHLKDVKVVFIGCILVVDRDILLPFLAAARQDVVEGNGYQTLRPHLSLQAAHQEAVAVLRGFSVRIQDGF